MSEQSIINKRIAEVTAENERLEKALAENRLELAELETAAKVVARLVGGTPRGVPKVEVGSPVKPPKPEGLPSMPELILMALRSADRPLEPKEITEVIRKNWWPDVEGQKIGSIVWRLNDRDDIEKVEGTSTYRLPQKNEPPDEKLGGDQSEGSLFATQAKGREAVPGGGP